MNRAIVRLLGTRKSILFGCVLGCALISFMICCDEIEDDDEETPFQSTVSMERDALGVWFISGGSNATLYDTFEMMGYAVATDRLWQMETYRRSARGTLAAILGPDYLTQDVLVRTTGYTNEEITDAYNDLDSESRSVLDGYIAGINRRIADIRLDSDLLPIEFAALRLEPAPWDYLDVLSWLAVMQRNFDPEALNQDQVNTAAFYYDLMQAHPESYQAMFQDLRWTNDPDALTYIEGEGSSTATPSKQPAWQDLPTQVPDFRQMAARMQAMRDEANASLEKIGARVKMGSYAWVLSGAKTASGEPIIYSGPQMGFDVPSIVTEGSIQAAGITVSGMTVPGIPGIIIGRTPHHAWSMQVGHAHTVDFYVESPEAVSFHRYETIKVKGEDDVVLPVFRSAHGPIVNPLPYDPGTYQPDPSNPLLAWKYSHWGHEVDAIKALLGMARATSMTEFGQALEYLAVSQHFCYTDTSGTIAYWMSGRDPVRPPGEYRFPQGFAAPHLEWDSNVLIERSHDSNPSQGYYCGWNNKSNPNYANCFNNYSYMFGPFHRAHVIDDILSSTNDWTYEQVRDLALNIALTDSFGGGGNPWLAVQSYFIAAVNANSNEARQAALELLAAWDGHFVDGGPEQWVSGDTRADAWVLMDKWTREVIRLTFEDELATPTMTYNHQNKAVLFNAILHGLAGSASSIQNYYPWFTNASGEGLPQTSTEIIVTALDNALGALGERPWNVARGWITYTHKGLGQQVWQTPFASRSTYAHCVQVGSGGPSHIQSMFPLGESGFIHQNPEGEITFDPNFFSMTPFFDSFQPRVFPAFN